MLKKNKVARIHELYEKGTRQSKRSARSSISPGILSDGISVRQNSRDMKHRSSLICAITARK